MNSESVRSFQAHLRSLLSVGLLTLMAIGWCTQSIAVPMPEEGNARTQHDQEPAPAERTLGTQHAHCSSGLAAGFACNGLDLKSRVPINQLGDTRGADLWGWVDPDTNREYAIFAASNGVSFVDITDPENPVLKGFLNPTTGPNQPWRDVKTYGYFVYVVADGVQDHGVQVFDLRRMRDGNADSRYTADYVYPGISDAHNIAINEATGFAYPVGDRSTCAGGIVFLDLTDPARPTDAGCFAGDGYTHDVQCAIYTGPDADYNNRELCFAANEDTVTLVDVTDKANPVQISRVTYPSAGYVHQGWLTEDQRYFLLGDELDEINFGNNTRTLIFDLQDLDNPQFMSEYIAPTTSIDHNLYIHGNRAYLANYTSGLRVLSLDDIARGELREIAYFDTAAELDGFTFNGAWSAYPYLPSGNILVSDREQGLFVLADATHDTVIEELSLDGRFSGQWVVTDQRDQGASIVVGENDQGPYVFFVWFTYLGGEPFWIVANAQYNDGESQITMPALRYSGLDFLDTDPAGAVRQQIGEISVRIVDCNRLEVAYTLDGLEDGLVEMQRLASVQGRECTDEAVHQ